MTSVMGIDEGLKMMISSLESASFTTQQYPLYCVVKVAHSCTSQGYVTQRLIHLLSLKNAPASTILEIR